MPKYLFAVLILLLAALACNWSDVAPPAAPVIEPSPLPTFAIPTETPAPTETPLPTLTPTPDVPIAWPKNLGVNCRYGPGKEWEAVSALAAGTIVQIKGRTVSTDWWYVQDPLHTDGSCWVAYDVVDTAGNMNIIPIVDAPTASVTDASADATVTFTACGGNNDAKFSGSLTSNGPTTVTYHWQVSGDAQYTTPDGTLKFTESGTQKVAPETYSADCGNYTVSLLVTDPNEISAEKAFKIQAP